MYLGIKITYFGTSKQTGQDVAISLLASASLLAGKEESVEDPFLASAAALNTVIS